MLVMKIWNCLEKDCNLKNVFIATPKLWKGKQQRSGKTLGLTIISQRRSREKWAKKDDVDARWKARHQRSRHLFGDRRETPLTMVVVVVASRQLRTLNYRPDLELIAVNFCGELLLLLDSHLVPSVVFTKNGFIAYIQLRNVMIQINWLTSSQILLSIEFLQC